MNPRQEPHLYVIGANHKTANIALREKLYIAPEILEQRLPLLKKHSPLAEIIVLSTCNRLELYGLSWTSNLTDEELYATFSALKPEPESQGSPKQPLIQGHAYIHRDQEAVRHLFRVSAGLDSLVLGETQITGQFKDAIKLSQRAETMGAVFQRLSQEALGVVKKLRNQTDISKRTVSIGHAAIDLAQQVYGSIDQHQISIIGAGDMGRLSALYALHYKPRGLFIVNRGLERAELLVRELGLGLAKSLLELEAVLGHSDIIITATASEQHLITRDMVQKIQRERQHRPLLIIDISLPRNTDPEIQTLDDVYLFDIDDLRQVVDANAFERQLAAEKAEALIKEAVPQFWHWLSTMDLKPLLQGFRLYLDELFQREAERTLGRELFRELPVAQKEALMVMLNSIANKISSDASMNVKKPPMGHYSQALAEALRVLFGPKDQNSREA